MSALLASLRFRLALLGWPAALGLACLVAAGLGESLVVMPMQAQFRELAQQIAERPAVASVPDLHPAPESVPAHQVELDAALGRLFSAARSNGLVLEKGDYLATRVETEATAQADGPIQVQFPLTGAYPALKRFIEELLEEGAPFRLERLTLRRERIEDTALKAELRLRLDLAGQSSEARR